DGIAGLRLEPEARVLGQCDTFGGKTLFYAALRSQDQVTVEREDGRIYCLQRNQQWVGRGARGNHRECLGHSRRLNVAMRQTLDRDLLLGRGLTENADGNV